MLFTMSDMLTKLNRAKEDPEYGYNWVMKCFKRPRQFYKMFRMSTEIFMSLHDLLVSSYGLISSRNVTSIESLAILLWTCSFYVLSMSRDSLYANTYPVLQLTR
jgi:hypothetical protein